LRIRRKVSNVWSKQLGVAPTQATSEYPSQLQ
jgi:hypothetical protein